MPAPAEPAPINSGSFTKLWVLSTYKVLRHRWLNNWRKHPRYGIRISPNLCVKAVPFMRLAEAHTMRFIAENTTIPVPKVYAAFEHRGQVYIVMERIKGKPVNHGWLERSTASQANILSQLKGMIDQLRAIPAPSPPTGGPGRVSDITGGPICDDRLPDKRLWGPFPSIDAFHRALRYAESTDPLYDAGTARVPWISELMAFHRRGDWAEPVLTHGRLAARAVLVRGDEVVALLDWESAGWMPPYWEYTSAWHANPLDRAWTAEVGRFVTPWPGALAMEIVRRGYFGEFYERF